MTATDLLMDLRARGLRLWGEGEGLAVAPRARLLDADRAAITAHKPALLALLADLEQLERDGTAGRRRVIAATLTAEEHQRLAAEAAAGDRLAELMVAVLATAGAGRGAPLRVWRHRLGARSERPAGAL